MGKINLEQLLSALPGYDLFKGLEGYCSKGVINRIITQKEIPTDGVGSHSVPNAYERIRAEKEAAKRRTVGFSGRLRKTKRRFFPR